MESRPLRVGFLSTAQIGRKVSWAAKEAGVALSAVASRDLAKAEAFAAAWGFAKAYGSYDELLADPDIDAVYIPLPTALHCEWVLKAAAAGKSVLLDKPCATSLGELARMTRACAAAGVQYMDNTMFMHGDRMAAMEAYLRGPGAPLGVLRSAQAAFTFNADAAFLAKDIRLQPALEPAGAIGDLGHYCVRFAMFAFGWDRPPATVAALLQARAGTPSAATATLMWEPIDGDDGVAPVATLTCGFHSAFRQTAEVAGTRGTLWLDDFVLARSGEAAFTVVIDPHMVWRAGVDVCGGR